MAEKVAKVGVTRDNNFMYYIKKGDVWRVPRKQPGQPKGKSEKVTSAGVDMDYGKYIYFLDGDGDIARQARQVGGSKRKAKKAAPKKAAKKTAKKAAKKTAKKGGAKKKAKKGKRK